MLKRWIRPVVVVIALGFLVHAGLDLGARWDGASVPLNMGYFLGGFVFAVLAMLTQLMAWRALVNHWCDSSLPTRASARLYLDSQMARYIPGKVGLPAVRISGAERVGVSRRLMASSIIVEMLSWCSTGALFGFLFLGLGAEVSGVMEQFSTASLALAFCAFVLLVILTTVDRAHFPQGLNKALDAGGEGPWIPVVMPVFHGAHFLSWMLCGVSLGLSVGASWEASLVVGALLCVAIVAGVLAVLAPAGAGVREAVMSVGLAPVIGASAALAVGVLARVASLFADIALWGWFRVRDRS